MKIDSILLRSVCIELHISSLNQRDYDFLWEFLMVMRPIANGITFLEGDKQLFGAYLPTLFGIKTALSDMETELTYCAPLLQAVNDGFNRRFGEMMDPFNAKSVPLFIAMVSNPMFKMSYIPPSFMRASVIRSIKNMLLTAGEKILNIFEKENLLPSIQKLPRAFESESNKNPSHSDGMLYFD